jgi:zeta toxin
LAGEPVPAAPGANRLNLDEHARIFRQLIAPSFTGPTPQGAPLAILLGGQPGIGKSSTKSALQAALVEHGGALDFAADLLRPFHPKFTQLLAGDERELAALDADIDHDARAWVDMTVEHAVTNRLHAILDSNLANPARAAGFLDRFSAAGYRVEVHFVAGPAALSRLGVLQRYQAQIDQLGRGAYCPVPIQERNYLGVLDTADMLDRDLRADQVGVFRRGGTLVYRQDRGPDGWIPHTGARQAIETERARPWTAAEQNWFLDAASDLAGRLTPDYLPDLHDACVLARPLFPATIATPTRASLEALASSVREHAGKEHAPRHERGEPAEPVRLGRLGFTGPAAESSRRSPDPTTQPEPPARRRQPGHQRPGRDDQLGR